MAENIQFTIGSFFNGEGFVKARESVNALNKNARIGATAVAGMAGAFSQVDGAAAKAMGAVTGLMSAFLTMNPVIAGITVAISALSWGVQKCREHQERLRKKTEEQRKEWEKLVIRVNQGIYDKAIADAKKLEEEFNRITKHANEMTAAINALNNQRASGSTLQLQADKITAIFNEVTEEGKQLVEAEYNLKIAVTQAQIDREKATQAVAASHQAVVDAENKIANLGQQRSVLEEELRILTGNEIATKNASEAAEKARQKNKADFEAKMAEIDAKILAAKEGLEVLHVKEQTAIAARETTETSISLKIQEAELAQEELTKSIAERKEREVAAAAAAEKKKQADEEAFIAENEAKMRADSLEAIQKEREQTLKDAVDLQNKANKAEAALVQARKAYQAALEKYHNTGDALIDGNFSPSARRDYENEGGAIAVQNALNGGTRAIQDLARAQRFGERATRDAERALRRASSDIAAHDRLLKKNQKLWTDADRKFDELMKKRKEQMANDKGELDAASNALSDAEKAAIETRDLLKDIKTKFESLGLQE